MKKLLAVSAMAAMLAGAAFAGTPTVSATGQVTFDVFNFSSQTKDFQIVSKPVKGGDEYMNLDVKSSDEKAGATLRIQSGTTNKAALNGGIWFKPIEQLKLTVAYGKLAADVTLDGLTFGGDIRGTVVDSATWKAPSWKAYVGYKADFGSVKAEAGNGTIYWRDNSQWGYAGVNGYAAALTFSTSLIPSTDLTARYGFYTRDKKDTADVNWMDLDVTATEKIGEVAITETVETEAYLNGGATLLVEANVEVPVEEVTIGATVGNDDVLKVKESETYVNLYVTGSFGVMGWKVGADFTGKAANGFNVAVPVTVTVNF